MADGGLEFKATSAEPSAALIDHAHLGRYTLGNRALEIEVLGLFADQAPLTLADLAAAVSEKDWHIAAHTLKGSARAVGARDVAHLAEIAEREGPAEPNRSRNLATLAASVADVRGYIASLTVVA